MKECDGKLLMVACRILVSHITTQQQQQQQSVCLGLGLLARPKFPNSSSGCILADRQAGMKQCDGDLVMVARRIIVSHDYFTGQLKCQAN